MSSLLGRTVRDAEGRSVGRIRELVAEIVLHPNGSDYVVTHFEVGHLRWLDIIASGSFVPPLLRRALDRLGYTRHELSWDSIDLSDPEHPRLVGRMAGE